MNVSIQDIFMARNRLVGHVRNTPLERSPALSEELGIDVSLKFESEQVTGSFKARGGFNKVLTLLEGGGVRGLIAPTAGGHGVGLSFAAKSFGIPVDIYLPRHADESKVRQIERNGATLKFFDDMPSARTAARAAAKERGLEFCSAYNDAQMIEAGGTIALEILERQPGIEVIVVGVGGGGLIAGMGVVLKAFNPSIQLIGVQPSCSPPLARWFEAKAPVHIPVTPSFAEGIGARVEEGAITWPYVRDLVDAFVLVSEDELKDAMAWMFVEHHVVIEGAAAASVAGLRKWRAQQGSVGRSAVAVLTGRNLEAARYWELVGPRVLSLSQNKSQQPT